MGNGKICDCCMDFTSLLQSYDRKRSQLNQICDVAITREEIETIFLYLQSWTQRQCSCCFREVKNFERFNWALQVLILVAVEILKNIPHLSLIPTIQAATSSSPSSGANTSGGGGDGRTGTENMSSSSADERMEVDVESTLSGAKEENDSASSALVSKQEKSSSESSKQEEVEEEKVAATKQNTSPTPPTPRPLWDVEDKDKLLHFVSKLFLNSFPTYVAYKQHTMQLKSQAHHVDQDMLLTPQEIQFLSIFCDINEPDASPYLFRNVSLFCRTAGIDALSLSVSGQIPDTMPIQRVNILVCLATNLKTWLNFQSLLKYYVPFRSYVMSYLCKIVDTDMKNANSLRNMTEFIWSAVKEPVDAHISFDKDGLDLAFKYFLSPTLTMRLAGVNQINSYINLFNELVNSEHIIDSEVLDQQLCKWLQDNQLIQHIFGPNLHVEVIKQSHPILTFLAMEARVTNEHIDIIWQAAQLKHCSKQVYDLVTTLISHLEYGPVLHLHNLLKKLEPKDHTEQSLYLASALLKFIWTNSTNPLTQIPSMTGLGGAGGIGPSRKNQRRLRYSGGGNGGVEISSSENSVSVDASHSDDEIQPGSPRDSGSKGGSDKRMYKTSSYLCKVIPTSSDESLSSNGDSDEDPDTIPVSGSFPPTAPANIETHSDSDADAERSGNEDCAPLAARKGRRKVLRRKKCTLSPKKRSGSGGNGEGNGITPKKLFSGGDTSPQGGGGGPNKEDIPPTPAPGPIIPLENIPIEGPIEPDPLEPNVVISQLGNLVQMTDASSMFQDYVSPPDNLDGSDGSYSSRMSNKSEKNMADFDGEDSNCDEDSLMQSLTQNQLVEMVAAGGGGIPPGARSSAHHQHQARLAAGGLMFGPRSMRRFNHRKRNFNQGRNGPGNPAGNIFNFQIENVCQPGQTLLWDLVQDDKIVQLSDGLAIEAQKALTNLLCFSTDKFIRFKFIEGCLDNLVKNKSVVVSLRLLPKLLTSFQPLRLTHHTSHSAAAAAAAEIHQVTLWADKEHQLLQKFFTNLQEFKKSDKSAQSPFPYHVHVQVRLEFLSVLFSILTSPDDFRLSLEQVDQLWESLATDARCSDDLFIWLTGQVRIREQHALSPEAFRYILVRKIPSLPPTTITMQALTLFQQLCSMTRISGILQDVETSTASMDYLWRIALCANSTDVSMTAIQYLNGYYISRQLEKEEEFVRRCMSHLVEATEELLTLQSECTDDEGLLLKIQRALVLLKTHLETFRRRYAYHLRKWLLEGRGVGSHAQLVGEKGAVPIRVVIQPAGYHEKVTLELLSSDYVADLRAEVAKWWETVQTNLALERCSAGGSSATPVLGSLLTEGPIRMITQGIELSAEYDEKCLSEVPVKDLQLVYVSMGASRPQKKRGASGDHHPGLEYSSSLPPPPRDKLPVTLLLQPQYFEQLFSLMQTLSSIKVSDRNVGFVPNTKAQVLSRRVWDILMLLPTNPSINEGFTNIAGADSATLRNLLDPHSPQKLMYSLYIVEALVKITPPKQKDSSGGEGPAVISWRQQFVECGGLRHLFEIFSSGQLETIQNGDWSEWKQDCLASLLKILCFLGVVSDDSECLSDQLYDVNEGGTPNKKRMSNGSGGSSNKRRKISTEKTPIPRLNDTMLSMMEESGMVMTRLTNILQACSLPRDPNHYKTGFWGRAQVVHYAMAMLVCWAFSCDRVRSALYLQKDFPVWLRRLVLEDPEPSVRKEACIGLYRLCLGVSTDGKTGSAYSPELISHLLKCLPASLSIKPSFKLDIPLHPYIDEPKDSYGPACRDYFWLLGRLIDSLDASKTENPVDLHELGITLSEAILNREYLEARHNTICDDGLVGLLSVMTVVMKHNPPFKISKMGQQFLKEIFDGLFSLPSPQQRYLPKFKAPLTRSAAYDLLAEMARNAPENYYLLQNLLMDQHQPNSHAPYPWDYWPHEDGRSSCGYVGLTNLGATCYMASCMQHLYMMPQARAAILGAAKGSSIDIQNHEQTLRELQKMFAYLMESERKAYNPRSFCKVYQMDHQPLNTGEQKDMAEFFIDVVSKLEEMTPELKKLVKNLFCGVLSNNVVSLDCTHVSRTLEEFYTVRCQVADMRNLYESLDEVTVKDTLEGDNMYTCSQCGKKVRAEKRACFKKLPRILCFNTMRYTFNMITMMKEKVNTHFSFPMQLDMGGYVEKTLMPQQYQEEKLKKKKEQAEQMQKDKEEDADKKGEDKDAESSSSSEHSSPTAEETYAPEEDYYLYELIGVTVHTGTADGGHYYSFIRDRSPYNRDKWYLFNDAEVKPFDPNQLAAECFGGEMSTKTYDSVTDKFMDFSFEKTNSAYMLFYEQCPPLPGSTAQGATGVGGESSQQNQMALLAASQMLPCLPGGSSAAMKYGGGGFLPMMMGMGQLPMGNLPAAMAAAAAAASQVVPVQPTIELNKELEDWIWHDNTQFLRDKNIFEHTYFNFMSHVCGQIPHSLVPSQEDVMLLAAKLSVTFFLETYIHAKEKPTMMQWVEMITKPLVASQPAAAWLLDHMAETAFWPVKIFLKCPNQIVRQMFHRLCFHVIQQLRPRHVHLYLKIPEGQQSDHPDDVNLDEFGNYSCVTRFVKSLLSLLENGAKSHLKHLTEYFTMLHDFSKMGDEECLFLINMQAISKMVGFYLGNKRDESTEHATDEEEDDDEIVSIPTEKNRVVSLEKMIALVATLVEKSRDESNSLRLSANDMMALTGGGKTFSFILQQIRDGINFTSTRNLIFSLCRWDDKLAESIVSSIFQTIQKHPDICQPYFKVLNLLAELVSGPPGMPKFTELILNRILDVADICAYPTLEWLSAQVPRNKIVHQWCLQSMDTWVEHFLIAHTNQRVRNAAASLLVSLVPHAQFRQGYRSTKFYMGHHPRGEMIVLPPDALMIMHEIYMRLLNLLKPAKHYTDISTHGTSKLTAYFAVLTYFTISKVEKLMFGAYFLDLWNLFHPKLSEPSIPCHHNKQALLTFWHHVCLDCPENIQKIICNPVVVKQIGFNYILADHEDQEVVMFNRNMLPAYYAILRMCCQSSRAFALHLARHQNINWAFKNISPFPTQYNAAVEELFKMMQIFVSKSTETNEQEIIEINHFKRGTLQLYLQILDGRSNWATMISAFRILIETVEDRIFVVANNGLSLIFEALHVLHTMHHEATACHVVAEIVELLSVLTEILRTFRPKDLVHGGIPMCNIPDIQIHRFILNSKEWPNILSKLATLLNTYNHGDLRNAAIDCLIEFLYTMPLDTLRTLVPLMVHCHSACQDAQTSGMGPPLGPYFPKRSASHHHHSHVSVKSSVRPPRPMLQMAFPHLGQETAKGLDEEYDRQLHDFYSQYHMFIDLMCRVAFMREYVTQELITLSAMVGYEAAPLHFVHFPKLWLEVHNTPSLDRKYITMLVNTNYFTDYVELVMLEERACLTNIMIFNFLATFLPKVFEQVGTTDQMCKVLLTIVMDMESLMAKQVMDIETHAIGILGDLKALTLFYVPTCQQKGPCKNPLPAPAPSVPYLQKTLRKFQVYLETVMQKRVRESVSRQQRQGMASPEGVPSKKRKLDNRSSGKAGNTGGDANKDGSSTSGAGASSKDEKLQSSASSSSSTTSSSSPSPVVNEHAMLPDAETQRSFITQDLITILLATIDNLLRGLLSANQGMTMESEEEDDVVDEGDEGPIIDVGGTVTSGGGVESKVEGGDATLNIVQKMEKAEVAAAENTETEVETEKETVKETTNETGPDQTTEGEVTTLSSEKTGDALKVVEGGTIEDSDKLKSDEQVQTITEPEPPSSVQSSSVQGNSTQ